LKEGLLLRRKKLVGTVLVITALLIPGFFIRLDYFIIQPSRAVNLREIIFIENADQDDQGSFYLVTVTQHRASPFTFIYGYLHPHMTINPMDSIIPVDMDESEYRQLLTENMIESRHLAQVVALRRIGYEVDIVSDGVQVIGFLENPPAEGFLEEGDKIIYVDEQPVFLATEVPLLVQDRTVGAEVNLTIVRGDQLIELSVPTGPSPTDEEMPFLGIFIKTLPWEPIIPININIKTGRIGGPSAGLMFVLEIMNQYLQDDLTAGKSIAGTGTIDLNENVGRIGGVVQKVIAAEKAGVDYFIVPEGNYEKAKEVARKVELVPVANLDQALQFLATLDQQP
jgi:Lon-like protease